MITKLDAMISVAKQQTRMGECWLVGGGEKGCNVIVFFSSQLVTVMIDHLLTVIVTKIVLSGLIPVRETEENNRQREEGGLVPLLRMPGQRGNPFH